jgi:hypothetical protein
LLAEELEHITPAYHHKHTVSLRRAYGDLISRSIPLYHLLLSEILAFANAVSSKEHLPLYFLTLPIKVILWPEIHTVDFHGLLTDKEPLFSEV